VTAIDRAVVALDAARIPYAFRRSTGAEPDASGEVDLTMTEADVVRAEPLFRSAGLHFFAAPGHEGHRFFLAFDEGRWLKLDVKTADSGTPGDGTSARLARRRPAGRRRLGPVVAILGPDGSGKGTIIDELTRSIPVGVTTVYLGRRRSSSGSPSTADSTWTAPRPLRESAFVVAKALRAWRKLLRGYAAAWRGHIVLCDRHPIEVLAIRPDRSRFAASLERFLARRLTPKPDAIVVLAAPAEVLLARKPEHPAATLRAWQRGYVDELVPMGAHTVDTSGPVEDSVTEVSRVVWDALRERRAW
jgi:thymidylate kinase